jgi:glutathione peroxidase
MSVLDIPVESIDGEKKPLSSFTGKAVLVVNVASQCGLTPQYGGLQTLHDTYKDKGFAVLGFPCNQFGAQEPGTHDEIKTFCESTFGVTFPLFSKIEVNGEQRHPLYAELTKAEDEKGRPGDIRWNFEKFLVTQDGTVQRFSPLVQPDDEALVAAVESAVGVDRKVSLEEQSPARADS